MFLHPSPNITHPPRLCLYVGLFVYRYVASLGLLEAKLCLRPLYYVETCFDWLYVRFDGVYMCFGVCVCVWRSDPQSSRARKLCVTIEPALLLKGDIMVREPTWSLPKWPPCFQLCPLIHTLLTQSADHLSTHLFCHRTTRPSETYQKCMCERM